MSVDRPVEFWLSLLTVTLQYTATLIEHEEKERHALAETQVNAREKDFQILWCASF